MKNSVMKKIEGGLIVSCQARVGWAMYGSEIMAAFAKAAKEGGAIGIRATGADNIAAIKKVVNLPIIGINKEWHDGCDVYITPTYKSAEAILKTGIDIIALDATSRKRPNNEMFEDIVGKIRENYPNVLIMGEVSTVQEAKNILPLNLDIISTTLSGYTEDTKDIREANIKLIEDIVAITDTPVIAEGKINTEEEAIRALKAGAYAIVIGTAITRPEIITKKYVDKINDYKIVKEEE
ncbi:N-acylglucosamine-6-phosphate 2-epimerase [Clostridium amylolyticum]|uniref:Putative N-acetylmannosamine-6-phosphate 2-epimerase n=1 Tax=Clostridium amylolyticum TaxID=1121298 RepID=A0A1M6NHF9_9CLOT|nr:N-acetylmannosamine-6-phosphate 2-epimerase [Clostridium amylolyticum]SHJ95063.1 N-acylglucosamine-6-phosphate 2-epimerase [Clostridium amylolyticum]